MAMDVGYDPDPWYISGGAVRAAQLLTIGCSDLTTIWKRDVWICV